MFYAEAAREARAPRWQKVGFDLNNGIGDLYTKIAELCRQTRRRRSRRDIKALYETAPDAGHGGLDRGITNLHVPRDVIIDASMPAAIRS